MSLLQISNKALRKIGVTELTSLTQQGKAADRCNRAVVDIVKEVLAVHTWSHATDWAALDKLIANPPFGYKNAYQAPVQTLHVFDVRSIESLDTEPENHEMVRNGIIYTDAEPCYARYVVYYETDLQWATPAFIDAAAFRLAAEVAAPLSKSEYFGPMMQGYQYAVVDAKHRDTASSKVQRPDPNTECKMLAARGYPQKGDRGIY